ncbi:hypothetical protein [Sulfitobacter sp.]|uniref:hypothetical protein n=1 Tax=Sulfitobacter sp. TaxID=1903071 RepID=UPI0039E52F4F
MVDLDIPPAFRAARVFQGQLRYDSVTTTPHKAALLEQVRPKSRALMTAIDQVSDRFGKKTMVLASEG